LECQPGNRGFDDEVGYFRPEVGIAPGFCIYVVVIRPGSEIVQGQRLNLRLKPEAEKGEAQSTRKI
jgi:hypothetical protein